MKRERVDKKYLFIAVFGIILALFAVVNTALSVVLLVRTDRNTPLNAQDAGFAEMLHADVDKIILTNPIARQAVLTDAESIRKVTDYFKDLTLFEIAHKVMPVTGAIEIVAGQKTYYFLPHGYLIAFAQRTYKTTRDFNEIFLLFENRFQE